MTQQAFLESELRDVYYSTTQEYPPLVRSLCPLDIVSDSPVVHRRTCRRTGTCVCSAKLSTVDWATWAVRLVSGKRLCLRQLTTDPVIVDLDTDVAVAWPTDLPGDFYTLADVVTSVAKRCKADDTKTKIELLKRVFREIPVTGLSPHICNNLAPRMGKPHTSDCFTLNECHCAEFDGSTNGWNWLLWVFEVVQDDCTAYGTINFDDAGPNKPPAIVFTSPECFTGTPLVWPATDLSEMILDAWSQRPSVQPSAPPAYDDIPDVRAARIEYFRQQHGPYGGQCPPPTLHRTYNSVPPSPPPNTGPVKVVFGFPAPPENIPPDPDVIPSSLPLTMRDALLRLGDQCPLPDWYGAWIEGTGCFLANNSGSNMTLSELVHTLLRAYTSRLSATCCGHEQRSKNSVTMSNYLKQHTGNLRDVCAAEDVAVDRANEE